MSKDKLFGEIRNADLDYPLLAQTLIRADRGAANYRLGASEKLAELREASSPARFRKIAAFRTLLCRLRYDDRLIFDVLVSPAQEKPMARTHAAILGASRPVEVLA